MSTCVNNRLALCIAAIIVKHLSDTDVQIKYSIKQMSQKLIKLNNFWKIFLDLGCQGVPKCYHITFWSMHIMYKDNLNQNYNKWEISKDSINWRFPHFIKQRFIRDWAKTFPGGGGSTLRNNLEANGMRKWACQYVDITCRNDFQKLSDTSFSLI